MIIEDQKLAYITGGAINISSSLINAISRMISTLLDLGRNVGSGLRYAISNKTCKL